MKFNILINYISFFKAGTNDAAKYVNKKYFIIFVELNN